MWKYVKVTPIQKFRGYAKTFGKLASTIKKIRVKRLKTRDNYLNILREEISVETLNLKHHVLTGSKQLLTMIINDPDLNLNFLH